VDANARYGPEGRWKLAGGKRSAAPGPAGMMRLRPGGAPEWWPNGWVPPQLFRFRAVRAVRGYPFDFFSAPSRLCV